MRQRNAFVSVYHNLNCRYGTKKCLLSQLDTYKLSLLWYSEKGDSDSKNVICKAEGKSSDPCTASEVAPNVPLRSETEPLPKDCNLEKSSKEDGSLKPFVNPCPPYTPCEPCRQPVHPCREKPVRAAGRGSAHVKEEFSMRTKKILLALSSLIGGIIIYKALTKPEEHVDKRSIRPRCVLRPQYIKKSPEHKEMLPTEVPYLIVGGGTAAFSAFRAIKSADPTAKILVVNAEPYSPYMRPPLTKELLYSADRELSRQLIFTPSQAANKWNTRSIYYEPEEFFTPLEELDKENGGISVIKGWSVQKVDPMAKTVTLKEGAKIKYEKCLLATGARARNMPIFEINSDNVKSKVTSYRTVYDFMEIEDVINCGGKSFAVIGGDNVACELACSLASRGFDVTQITKHKGVMHDILPAYLSDWLSAKIEETGVKLMKDTMLEDATVTNGKLKLITKERQYVPVDHAVVACGGVPNTDLALESGIEVDPIRGGFLVNPEMQIRSDLYAAGDCASFFDPRFGRRRLENHDHAIVSGRIAGENMTGGSKIFDKQSTFWSAITPSLQFESVGVVDSELPTVGVYLDKDSETRVVDSSKKDGTADDFSKGVVFYLKNNIVVGIVMWNILDRSYVAQGILSSKCTYEQTDDAAKLFSLHV